MTHTVTIIGLRRNGIGECWYEVEVEVSDVVQVFPETDYTPAEYEGGNISSITYEGLDVSELVLSVVSEDEITDCIERESFEVESTRFKQSVAA